MLRLFRGDAERVSETPSIHVDHDGETFRVFLKRSRTARRFTLRVRAATREVVLTMPARGSMKAAREFAERYAGWIDMRLQRLPALVTLSDGAIVPFRGIDHTVVHRPGARGTVWPEVGAGGEPILCVAGEVAHIGRRLTDFFKREARKDLVDAVERHSRAAGTAAKRVTLRDTTSRWGSCSSKGSLSFSWRLILAPPFVLDYLAAHEVAHLVHMNHSAAYWKTTRGLAPHTDRAEAWLRAHGATLHRYTSATVE